MAETNLAAVPQDPERRPLPELVRVNIADGMPPHSPVELERLEQQAGQTFEQLTGEGASNANRERALIWLSLCRLGYQPEWADVGQVLIDYAMPDPLDAASFLQLAAVCKWYGLAPRDVYAMTGEEYAAFVSYRNTEVRRQNREARKGRRG